MSAASGWPGRLRDVSYGLSITVPVVRMREPELAAKFLPVLAAVLRRLTAALTTAEWFEPGAITVVQEGLAREDPRLQVLTRYPGPDRSARSAATGICGWDITATGRTQAPPGADHVVATGLRPGSRASGRAGRDLLRRRPGAMLTG